MTTDKMLIDAAHPEETRVVVLRGNRIEEFDFESAAKKLLRGNIYLAKITRVEPSLQAAFVDYGGNRHGFLAFSEIHPDYYQIPVADRQALLREEAEAAADEARRDAEAGERGPQRTRDRSADDSEIPEAGPSDVEEVGGGSVPWDVEEPAPMPLEQNGNENVHASMAAAQSEPVLRSSSTMTDLLPPVEPGADEPHGLSPLEALGDAPPPGGETPMHEHSHVVPDMGAGLDVTVSEQPAVEETPEDSNERRRRPRRAQYKIQEVIKRRQIILVQVVKEERGNKGAALTTYLSLAGRYTVLMPNTARGGGISRKITNAVDRKRLKEITSELQVPDGMGLIVRTAGASRAVAEIKRDFEYLSRLWESVRDLTLTSSAPALVYEEGSLVKRSIRDLYSKDIDEIVVAGKDAYEGARDFMHMMMPSHVKNVKHYADSEPLFARYQIERQLNAMYSPYVTLRSGGYIVINQTEALVAIDVNSGKATREHSIEETAHVTNLEAADEIARQLRLRDLAGLIVIDFIDMEERRNNRAVERRLKDALRFDRARIQVGRISHFGLMEMSRQRLRTGVLEGSTTQCPHCQGTGLIRSVESVSLAVLRALEDNLMGRHAHNLVATTSIEAALYLLNEKRSYLRDIEQRYGVSIEIDADAQLQGSNFRVDTTGEPLTSEPLRPRPAAVQLESAGYESGDDEADAAAVTGSRVDVVEDSEDSAGESGDRKRSKRRRRRGGRNERDERSPAVGHGDGPQNGAEAAPDPSEANGNAGQSQLGGTEEANLSSDDSEGTDAEAAGGPDDTATGENGERRGRRRGRRGGRRNRRGGREGGDAGPGDATETAAASAEREPWMPDSTTSAPGAEQPDVTATPWDRNGRIHVADSPRHDRPGFVAAPPEASVYQATAYHAPEPVAAAEAAVLDHPIAQAKHNEEAEAVGSALQQVTPPVVHIPEPQPAQSAEPAAESVVADPRAPAKRGWWTKRFTGG